LRVLIPTSIKSETKSKLKKLVTVLESGRIPFRKEKRPSSQIKLLFYVQEKSDILGILYRA
jgi:hypothetical protein